MPKTNPDPGLSWARQIIDIQSLQAKEGAEPETEWSTPQVVEQAEAEQPDTIKTTNCMHWALIYLFICVLMFLLSLLLAAWMVLR